MPGSVAVAKIDTDLSSTLTTKQEQVKQLRRDIAAAEREMSRLLQAGNMAQASSYGTWVKGLEQQAAGIATQIKAEKDKKKFEYDQNRAIDKRLNQALHAGQIFKSFMGAQALRSLVQGELDARGLVGLAIMSERTIAKAARQLGGVNFGNTTKRWLRAAPLIGEVISAGVDLWSEQTARIKWREKLDKMVKGGKISWAEANLGYRALDESPFSNPAEMQENVSHSADALLRMSQDQQRRALAGITILREDDKQAAVASYFGSSTQRSYVPLGTTDVIKRYETLLDQARNNGLIMNEAVRKEMFGEALAGFIADDKEREKVAKAIWESVSNFQIENKENTVRTVRDKFKLDEERRKNAVEAQRWIIPARLEY